MLSEILDNICRAGKKDPSKTVEDLRKAIWYLNRYINVIEHGQQETRNEN